MNKHYILDENKNLVVVPLERWATWLEKAGGERIVNQTMIGNKRVSTVFLGFDHSFGRDKPLLFETMIFYKEGEGKLHDRYSTYLEAVEGHNEVVDDLLSKE